MSTVFCDTSALYALVQPTDEFHEKAATAWQLLVERHKLLTSNYIIVETIAICQTRVGLKAATSVLERIEGVVDIGWIDPALHDAALQELLTSNRRQLSFMDCTSFAFMRRHRIDTVFTFDPHFTQHGFKLFQA